MKLPIIERTALVFAGWQQQFENPPVWLPKISVGQDGVLLLDGFAVCQADQILAIICDTEQIFFDTESSRYVVHIEWPFEGIPHISSVVSKAWPSFLE